MRTKWTLALDLEGTLISSAVSQFPRPGLKEFLNWAGKTFGRVVIYSSVREEVGLQILTTLAAEGNAPSWVIGLEYFEPIPMEDGLEYKELRRVGEHVLLVDDYSGLVPSDQQDCLVLIEQYDPTPDNQSPEDTELARVRTELEQRLSTHRAAIGLPFFGAGCHSGCQTPHRYVTRFPEPEELPLSDEGWALAAELSQQMEWPETGRPGNRMVRKVLRAAVANLGAEGPKAVQDLTGLARLVESHMERIAPDIRERYKRRLGISHE